MAHTIQPPPGLHFQRHTSYKNKNEYKKDITYIYKHKNKSNKEIKDNKMRSEISTSAQVGGGDERRSIQSDVSNL